MAGEQDIDASHPKGREQFRKVTTGNGFSNDLTATTNDRLELTVIELQNLQKNNSDQTEKLGKQLTALEANIKSLTATIKVANEKNDKLQKWFLILAVISAIFAATGLIQAWDILARGVGK